MSRTRSRFAAPVAIALALVMAPALTGCFGNPIESIIEGATGGNVDLGGTTLPSDYPTAEVPLIDGEIINAGAIGNDQGKIFNVTIRVADVSAFDTIKAELEAAGFVSPAESSATSEGGTYLGSTDAWGVVVIVSQDGSNGWVANYTVTSTQQ